MKTKVCAKCKIEKTEDKFSSGAFTQRYGQCRECANKRGAEFRERHKNDPKKEKTPEQKAARKAYEEAYQEKNKELLRQKKAEFRKNNREKINQNQNEAYHSENEETRKRRKQRNKEWIDAHREEVRLWHANYRAEKKEQIKAQKKQHREKNKERLKQEKKAFYEERKNDPLFKLRLNISGSIRTALQRMGSGKSGASSLDSLPYKLEELHAWIEKQFSSPENLTPDGKVWMNWENWGRYRIEEWNDNDPSTWKWQLDHIIPHSSFGYTSMDCEEFRKCWGLENLRPLSAKQNMIDGVRDFEIFWETERNGEKEK